MRWVIRGIAALIVIGAAVGGYLYWSEPDQMTALIDEAMEVVSADQASTPARRSSPPPKRSDIFEFRRLEIDTSKEEAEACLVFTQDLESGGDVQYQDYLKIEPQTKVGLRVLGSRLCMAGLKFDREYSVTVRKGLPSEKGLALAEDETFPVELRDRPPVIAFGGGILLPRQGSDGLPIDTINVDELDLSVIRVNDRLLSQLSDGLIDQKLLYGYEQDQLINRQGELVWQGSMPIKGARNEETTTVFPIREAIDNKKPGIYLVIAADAADQNATGDRWDQYYKGKAAQWVIDSDIGLTTFKGADGLHVFARSLQRATPLSRTEVALVARNNDELARAKLDGDGSVHFPAALMRGTGGSAPVAVMAYGNNGDFTFLDLRRPAFDLTDRGVEGRATPGPIDAYLYTERGIYRPGQTVHVVTMLRDPKAQAMDDAPLTLILRRPDGNEYRRYADQEQSDGAAHTAIALSDSAPRGQWEVTAHLDPKQPPVGRVKFDVQDFVPQKLEVSLKSRSDVLRPGADVAIEVEGRFLYGAPASALAGEGEMRLVPDSEPFPEYKTYRFGLVEEEYSSVVTPFSLKETDSDGKTLATSYVETNAETTKPLKAEIKIGLFEPGGRTTFQTMTLPVRTDGNSIGIRPAFDDDRIQENSNAEFDVVVLDAEGEPVANESMIYELVREDTDYQWYQLDGQWRYETVIRDRIVSGGNLEGGPDGTATFKHLVEWGRYRFTVSDTNSKAASSVRFYAGWAAGGSRDRPDRVAVTSDKEFYALDEKAVIDIRPPVNGKALVLVAGDEVYERRLIDVSVDGTQFEIDVSEEWGSGTYVLVTSFKPLNSQEERAPVRAIGLTWIGIDHSKKTLDVALELPDVVKPRTDLTVPVTVSGLSPGAKAHVTIAAVDEGILQLTRFSSPSPTDFYFGKRRLGLDVRDDYGRLIDVSDDVVGTIRVGGDSLGGRGLSAVPTRTVSLFSGIVSTDASGRADVSFRVPDFVGELRVMAVAFNATQLGNMEQPITVRDDVVAEISLPRFLAPNDKSFATLTLHNVEGEAGSYSASISGADAVTLSLDNEIEAELAVGDRKTILVPLQGNEPGIGTVSLKVEGPDGFGIARAWPIEVRPPQMPVFNEDVAMIGPGDTFQLTAGLVADLIPGTESVVANVASSRGYDATALVRWLDRYPYGCLEQTTSRAFPLLLMSEIDEGLIASDTRLEDRIQKAVDRVVDMQHGSGSFGMWSPYSRDTRAWLGVFAMDFLLTAKSQGYVVPNGAMDRGLSWLRQLAGENWQPDASRAYAYYVLARQGAVSLSDLRYFSDTEAGGFKDLMASSLTGAALSLVDDRARAKTNFDRVLRLTAGSLPGRYEAIDYGSLLRDVAGATAMAVEAQQNQAIGPLVDRGLDLRPPIQFTTTQEKAWMVRAASALARQRTALAVQIDGVRASGPSHEKRFVPSTSELASGISIRNDGDRPIWRTVTVEGVPKALQPAAANIVSVDKTYWTLAGTPASLASVKQNERFVVSIKGVVEDNVRRDLVVLDLLPAGFEIESIIGTQSDSRKAYGWLTGLTRTNVAEARDDRFVASFNVGSTYRSTRRGQKPPPKPNYHVAYIVRAVTPGSYVVPAAVTEDMYRPNAIARTEARQMTISARN